MVVYSGDGDLFAIGGNHLIHAARRNVDLKVICVNNLIYAMTGGQTAPTTPGDVITSTAPYGTYDPAFNLPYLVEAAGAVYVARWTTFHVQAARALHGGDVQQEGLLLHRGDLALPDAVPAPQQDGRRTGHHEVLQAGQQDQATARPPSEVGLTKSGEIIVGKFVDRERPDYRDLMHDKLIEPLGDEYVETEASCMQLTEIRIAGFGGQGVILSAIVIGKAGCIYRGRLLHHDPELRSGSARRRLQRAGHSLGQAGALSLRHAARTSWL